MLAIAEKEELIRHHHKKVDLIFQPCDCREIIETVLKTPPRDVIQEIIDSGLRGRGGAGFSTGHKWNMAAQAESAVKYVVCNADEGEPGTFKDREILERVPEKVFAGIVICAHAIGATEAYLYLRGEYGYLLHNLEKALDRFNRELGPMGVHLPIAIRLGSGAYICGEETSLIESMEGRRGEPRNRPPFPIAEGYKGKPTVVNNVETLVQCVMIMKIGADNFAKLGTADSRGSKVFCVSGDAVVEGIFELELGMTVQEFVDMFGDGDTKMVQIGGYSGFCIPRNKFEETVIGFEGVPTGGAVMLFNSTRSMYNVLHNFLEFFQEESCGQCTPCRVGCRQLLLGIEAVKRGDKPAAYLDELRELTQIMSVASKCGLGRSVANPFLSIVDNFRDEFVH